MAIKIVAQEKAGCVTFKVHPTSQSEIGKGCVPLVRLPTKIQRLRVTFRISLIAHMLTQMETDIDFIEPSGELLFKGVSRESP